MATLWGFIIICFTFHIANTQTRRTVLLDDIAEAGRDPRYASEQGDKETQGSNNRPIIGIISQTWSTDTKYSYIASSYVKLVESGGARVIVLQQDLPEAELERRFKIINGLLIPGGGVPLEDGYPFYDTTNRLLELALRANDKGDYFPVLGICLGFEALVRILSGDPALLTRFDALDSAAILEPTQAANSSSLFSSLRPEVVNALYTQPYARESHSWGVSPKAFSQEQRLQDFFSILTTSTDRQGKEYVSTVEGKRYPVIATQWHPEKNSFEWGNHLHIPHSTGAIEVTHEVARYFVSQARRSSHRALSLVEEDELLIYNYPVYFTGKHLYESDRAIFDEEYILPAWSKDQPGVPTRPTDS